MAMKPQFDGLDVSFHQSLNPYDSKSYNKEYTRYLEKLLDDWIVIDMSMQTELDFKFLGSGAGEMLTLNLKLVRKPQT